MNNKKKLAGSLGGGLVTVASVEDIPDALLEAESECSALAKEFRSVMGAKSELAAVLSIWESRAGIILETLADCRRIMTVQSAKI